MIQPLDRKIVLALVWAKIWRANIGLFRTVEIKAPRGTRWLLRAMKRRQTKDARHHAPCCPANHFHYQRLVFSRCNCGAHP